MKNRRPSSKNVLTQNLTRNSRRLTPMLWRKLRLLSSFRSLLRTKPRKVKKCLVVCDRKFPALSIPRWRRRGRYNTSWLTVNKQHHRRTVSMTGQTVLSSGRKSRCQKAQLLTLALKVSLTRSPPLSPSLAYSSPSIPRNWSSKRWNLVSLMVWGA